MNITKAAVKLSYFLLCLRLLFSVFGLLVVSTPGHAEQKMSVSVDNKLSCERCGSLLTNSEREIPNLEYDWYFAIDANQGIIDLRGSDEYLILNHYDKTVRAYSNRPYELFDRFDIREMVSLWDRIYLNTLPKAMVSGYRKLDNGQLVPVFFYVQLSQPRIISDYTVEFVVFSLDDENLPNNTVIHKVVVDLTEDYHSIHRSSPHHLK